MRGVRPLVGAVGLVGGYMILFALVHPLAGPVATVLAIVPATIGAASFGLRWGLTITAAAGIATGLLWYVFGDEPGSVVLRVGGGAGIVVVFVVAAALGRLRDLERETARRLRQRDELLEARSRLEQWLHDVTGSFPVVLLALDQDGRIRRSTGAGLARLGLEEGSLDGRSVFDLCVSATDRAAVRSMLAGAPAFGASTIGYRRLSFNYLPTSDIEGRVTGGFGVAIVD